MPTSDDFVIEHRFSDRYMAAIKRFGMKRNEQIIELLVEQNEQLEQQLAQARALLEEQLTKPSTDNWGQGPYCEFCGGWMVSPQRFAEIYGDFHMHFEGIAPSNAPWYPLHHGHSEQCLYTRIRAFLAQHKEHP